MFVWIVGDNLTKIVKQIEINHNRSENYKFVSELGACGLVVWTSACHTEGCGFDAVTGIFPDYLSGYLPFGNQLCCPSLILVLWIG